MHALNPWPLAGGIALLAAAPLVMAQSGCPTTAPDAGHLVACASRHAQGAASPATRHARGGSNGASEHGSPASTQPLASGGARLKNNRPPDPGSGTGGATIISVQRTSTYGGLAVTAINGVPVTPRKLAAGTACNGTYTGTFNGSITVTAGQHCRFTDGIIHGNVDESGGNLVISETRVDGSVSVHGGTFGLQGYTWVRGNFQVRDLPKTPATLRLCDLTVDGDVRIAGNAAPIQIGSSDPAACGGIIVHGDLDLIDNAAATTVTDNEVLGALHCTGNARLSGSGNEAQGAKLGQCARL